MIRDMRAIAFIPAKGHSERLPGKVLAQLGGLPLLAWTILAADRSGVFARVIVSSESEQVLEVARQYHAEPLLRSKALALPLVTVDMIVADALEVHAGLFTKTSPPYRTQKPWALYVLLPTSPFRSPATITVAWRTFRETEAKRLLSVIPVAYPPEWCLRLTDRGTVEPMDKKGWDRSRQRLRPAYRHDGGHDIRRIDGGPGLMVGFRTPEDEVLDINTPADLVTAELRVDQGRVPWKPL